MRLGDLSDDLVLMNELENIRHVKLNKRNNSSLGMCAHMSLDQCRRLCSDCSRSSQGILRLLRKIRLPNVVSHSAGSQRPVQAVADPSEQGQRLARVRGEPAGAVDERVEESRRIRRRTFPSNLREGVTDSLRSVQNAAVALRRMSSDSPGRSDRSRLSGADLDHARSADGHRARGLVHGGTSARAHAVVNECPAMCISMEIFLCSPVVFICFVGFSR